MFKNVRFRFFLKNSSIVNKIENDFSPKEMQQNIIHLMKETQLKIQSTEMQLESNINKDSMLNKMKQNKILIINTCVPSLVKKETETEGKMVDDDEDFDDDNILILENKKMEKQIESLLYSNDELKEEIKLKNEAIFDLRMDKKMMDEKYDKLEMDFDDKIDELKNDAKIKNEAIYDLRVCKQRLSGKCEMLEEQLFELQKMYANKNVSGQYLVEEKYDNIVDGNVGGFGVGKIVGFVFSSLVKLIVAVITVLILYFGVVIYLQK